jgi:ABC-2 type transport system ATP-binding protein
MSDIAIGVHGLRKHFGEVEALTGADFEVQEGTVFGLLGPNGAGKTTIVRVLSTILSPDDGHAEVLGYDVVASQAVRRGSARGAVRGRRPNLTGRENLEMVGVLAQMPRPAIRPRARSCWIGSCSPTPATRP